MNVERSRAPGRGRALRWLLLLVVAFAASACISVQSDLLATPTPSLAPSGTPGADASPTRAPLASPTPTPSPQPTPQPVEAEVLGFVPNWLVDDAVESIDTDHLTIAAFHSIEAGQDGKLVSRKPNGDVPPGWTALRSDTFKELQQKLQRDGVKVVPVISRIGWTEASSERVVTLLTKKKNRRALAGRIADFVSDRGFDGVNLDFEPIPTKVADQYVEFVREVRAALDAVDPGLHLSIDVLPSLAGYDLAALTADDAADLAVIMGYGYRTGAAKVAGSTAPLVDASGRDLTSTVEAALEQAEADRLMLALPWYGRAWSTQTDKAGSEVRSGKDIDDSASAGYSTATERAIQSGRKYEPEQASAWTAYPAKQCNSCPASWRQLWYDDADSFTAKADFALGQGLAGIGIWTLGMDEGREEMAWALRNVLQPRFDEIPPNGSAALDPEAVRDVFDGRSVVVGSAPLRLFAEDEADGTGLVMTRIGLAGELDSEGVLVTGRSYPAAGRIDFPLGDEATGGSPLEGPRSIYVQWRDLAGNWSAPVVIEAHVIEPDTSTTPSDL